MLLKREDITSRKQIQSIQLHANLKTGIIVAKSLTGASDHAYNITEVTKVFYDSV